MPPAPMRPTTWNRSVPRKSSTASLANGGPGREHTAVVSFEDEDRRRAALARRHAEAAARRRDQRERVDAVGGDRAGDVVLDGLADRRGAEIGEDAAGERGPRVPGQRRLAPRAVGE